MKTQEALEKLQRIVQYDLDELGKNTIVKDGDRYLVFGLYEIIADGGLYSVTRNSVHAADFSSLRVAMSYCIADKYNQFYLTQNILKLESQKQRIQQDLDTRSFLARRIKSLDRKECVDIKLSSRRMQLDSVKHRLDKCVILAKYWQIKGFNNETARTGRTASNRKNRQSL